MVLAAKTETVSVITMSDSNVALAKRPAITGTFPMGLHKISPSPRKPSAIAVIQISSIVASSAILALFYLGS